MGAMPTRDSKPQGSGRVKLLTVRFLALMLLTLSLIGLGLIAVGAYLSVANGPSGRAAVITVGILGALVGMLIAIAMRALRTREADELEKQETTLVLEKLQEQLDTRGEPYP